MIKIPDEHEIDKLVHDTINNFTKELIDNIDQLFYSSKRPGREKIKTYIEEHRENTEMYFYSVPGSFEEVK